MTSGLHKKFNAIEDTRLRISFHVSSWEDEQFNLKPSGDKWSPGQVIFHLVQVEQFSVSYVKKKLSYPGTLKKTGAGTSFRFFLLKFFLNLPVKYKAPAPVSIVPEILSREELLKQWEDTRKEMGKLLDNFPAELLDKNIFKHLVAGRLTISQMLDFINDHINHHLPQILNARP